MEMIFQRLPLLGEKISKNIDVESLVKLRESSKELAKSIDDERFYWIRIIKHYKDNLQAFQENWMIILDKIPIIIVKDLAIATQKFFKAFYICYISPWRQKWSPIHIASQQGNLRLFKYRTRAIITRGLYFFYPIFTAVYIRERFILQSG